MPDILKLVQRIHAECPGKDIWVWTGYKLDELNAAQMQVVDLINVLVDGKFVQDLKDRRLSGAAAATRWYIICVNTRSGEAFSQLLRPFAHSRLRFTRGIDGAPIR